MFNLFALPSKNADRTNIRKEVNMKAAIFYLVKYRSLDELGMSNVIRELSDMDFE